MSAYGTDFEAFWTRYPRKNGTSKKTANDSYLKAIKSGATHADIMRGLVAYPFNAEAQFQPHAATWLNQRRWEIEQDTAAPTVIVQPAAPSRSSWRDRYDHFEIPFQSFPEGRRQRLDQPSTITIEGHHGDD